MANIDISVLVKARDEASAVLKNIGSQMGKTGDSFKNLGGDIRNVGIGLAAFGTAGVFAIKSIVGAAAQMEQARVAFETLTGSVELGRKTLENLINFAAKTPFEIPQVMEQSKRLLAMGTSVEDLIPTLRMLGDVAAGVGMEKLPQLVLAFGQIQAKGRLMGTELRQLTEAGFNLADAMGITNKELEQFVSEGTVGFEDVKKAFQTATEEGGRFHNLMQNQALTTSGQLSNLNDNIFKLKASLGEALLPAVNQLIQTLLPATASFAAWAKEHQNLVIIATAATLIIAALGAAILILIPIFTALSSAVTILGAVFTAVGTIITTIVGILGGPLTIAILAILALAAVFTLAWKNNWLGIRDIVANVVAWFKDVALPAVSQVFNAIKGIVSSVAQHWIDRFNAIKNAVSAVVDAIRSVISAAENMANRIKSGLKIPGFQTGGVVPGPIGQPQMAVVHGGEQITPVGGGSKAASGGGLTFNVTIGLYAGSETEKRNIGRELYEGLVRVAQSQNLSVAEMLGA